MQVVNTINFIVSAIFFICYFYQFAYYLAPFVLKRSNKKPVEYKKYAVMISARNEESVIANLIDSIKNQNYPKGLVDIFVVADNCTDNTASVAREAGAYVWERQNKEKVGKGYALDFLYSNIQETFPDNGYAGYFVFDADNVLDSNYIREMNKVYNQGYKVITSYRNSKNYGTNWISAGYSLGFLRESKYTNEARMLLGTSCAISGTGFLVSSEIFARNNGWKFFLLTEDIQFTSDCISRGEKIGYCKDAILYDEQPFKFSQSWKQRVRWAKGFYQVFAAYGAKLFKGIFTGKGFACYDMLMVIMPLAVLSTFALVLNFGAAIVLYASGQNYLQPLGYVGGVLMGMYSSFYLFGLITTITEWKKIKATPFQKIIYTFTFPLFQATYYPIAVAAIFKKVEWEPIAHTQCITIEELQKSETTVSVKTLSSREVNALSGLYSEKD